MDVNEPSHLDAGLPRTASPGFLNRVSRQGPEPDASRQRPRVLEWQPPRQRRGERWRDRRLPETVRPPGRRPSWPACAGRSPFVGGAGDTSPFRARVGQIRSTSARCRQTQHDLSCFLGARVSMDRQHARCCRPIIEQSVGGVSSTRAKRRSMPGPVPSGRKSREGDPKRSRVPRFTDSADGVYGVRQDGLQRKPLSAGSLLSSRRRPPWH